MKPFNQFDMEQQIMTCWSVCEDLHTLTEGVLERDMTPDQISNVLIGMRELYQLKFQTLWEHFEAMCSDGRKMKDSSAMLFKDPDYIFDREDDKEPLNARGEVL